MGVHKVKAPMRSTHQCPMCPKSFSNIILLQQHIRYSHQNGTVAPLQPYMDFHRSMLNSMLSKTPPATVPASFSGTVPVSFSGTVPANFSAAGPKSHEERPQLPKEPKLPKIEEKMDVDSSEVK